MRPTLLFAGSDGIGFGARIDPRDLGSQGGDLAVGTADVRARWVTAGVVGSPPAAVAHPVAVRVAQCGEPVVIAGQEHLQVLVDLEAAVGDQGVQFAFTEVRPGVGLEELGGRGAVMVGGWAADLLPGIDAFVGLGEGLGQARLFSWSRTSSMSA
ncbi:hypothetical protein [Streptomyces sp. NPDC004008]